MATTVCPQCQKDVPEGTDRCPHCGAKTDPRAFRRRLAYTLFFIFSVPPGLMGLGLLWLFAIGWGSEEPGAAAVVGTSSVFTLGWFVAGVVALVVYLRRN